MERREARLYVNGSQDDREALKAVQKAGVKFSLGGPLENQSTPLLIASYVKYQGLRRIEEYLRGVRQR